MDRDSPVQLQAIALVAKRSRGRCHIVQLWFLVQGNARRLRCRTATRLSRRRVEWMQNTVQVARRNMKSKPESAPLHKLGQKQVRV